MQPEPPFLQTLINGVAFVVAIMMIHPILHAIYWGIGDALCGVLCFIGWLAHVLIR